jgi:flagellar M-ring protein FliF
LKRLSVSVLVDNVSRWEGQGSNLKRVSTPPSPEVLDRITEVVSAAAGIVPGRGDTLVVQTLPFQMTQEEPPVGALPEQAPKSPWDTKILSLVGVFLALAAVAWWMMRSQKRIPAPAEVVAKPAALAAPTEAAPEPLQVSAQAVAQQLAKKLEQQRAGLTDSRQRELEAAGSALQRMVGEAIELTKSDSELCAGVLRGWLMEQPREKVREANV